LYAVFVLPALPLWARLCSPATPPVTQLIQEQRKAANMTASLHRNKVNQLMESMKNIHNIEKLAPGGSVDASALTSQLQKL
jgi:hypothetical protein